MNTLAFDGVLKAWLIVGFRDGVAIAGRIYGDRKCRFDDGRWIMTSRVITPQEEIGSGRVVQTRNSRYLLVGTVH